MVPCPYKFQSIRLMCASPAVKETRHASRAEKLPTGTAASGRFVEKRVLIADMSQTGCCFSTAVGAYDNYGPRLNDYVAQNRSPQPPPAFVENPPSYEDAVRQTNNFTTGVLNLVSGDLSHEKNCIENKKTHIVRGLLAQKAISGWSVFGCVLCHLLAMKRVRSLFTLF